MSKEPISTSYDDGVEAGLSAFYGAELMQAPIRKPKPGSERTWIEGFLRGLEVAENTKDECNCHEDDASVQCDCELDGMPCLCNRGGTVISTEVKRRA